MGKRGDSSRRKKPRKLLRTLAQPPKAASCHHEKGDFETARKNKQKKAGKGIISVTLQRQPLAACVLQRERWQRHHCGTRDKGMLRGRHLRDDQRSSRTALCAAGRKKANLSESLKETKNSTKAAEGQALLSPARLKQLHMATAREQRDGDLVEAGAAVHDVQQTADKSRCFWMWPTGHVTDRCRVGSI